MWIPVSGTVFVVVLVVGGLLWLLELSGKASRASGRRREQRAREATRSPADASAAGGPREKGGGTAAAATDGRGARRGLSSRRAVGVIAAAALVVAIGAVVVHHLRPDRGCGLSADEVSSITEEQSIEVHNDTDDPSGVTGKVCLYSRKDAPQGTGLSLLIANFHGGTESAGATDRSGTTSGERCSSRSIGAAEKAYVCVDGESIDARFGSAGWSCEVSLGGFGSDLGIVEGQVGLMVTKVISKHQCD